MLQTLCTRAFGGYHVIWLYVFEESPMKVKKKKPERDAQAFFRLLEGVGDYSPFSILAFNLAFFR